MSEQSKNDSDGESSQSSGTPQLTTTSKNLVIDARLEVALHQLWKTIKPQVTHALPNHLFTKMY